MTPIGNRIRDLPVCSALPQPTASRRAFYKYSIPCFSATYFGEEEKFSELVMRLLHAREVCNPSHEKHLSCIIASWSGTLQPQSVSLRVNEPIKATVTPEQHQIKSSSKLNRELYLFFFCKGNFCRSNK
jgi:hypothetical protein